MISGIPMKSSDVLKFVHTGGLIEFDFSKCAIGLTHALQYIAYLKVTHTVSNHSPQLLIEYIRCPWLLGKTNLIDDYKNLMCLYVHGHVWAATNGLTQQELESIIETEFELLDDVWSVIQSLPHFLFVHTGDSHSRNAHTASPACGVNFARLFEDDAFLSYMLHAVLETEQWRDAPYFTRLFDEYIYGGDNLVWFVTSNPECSLTSRRFE